MNRENINKYKKILWNFLTDELTPGEIDELERPILEKYRKSLEISEELAQQVEKELIDKWNLENNTPQEFVEKFPILGVSFTQSILEKYSYLRKDLVSLALRKNFPYVNIQTIYNEGRTGALVFKFSVNVNNKEYSRILKYDNKYKIKKEYDNFVTHEIIHGKLTSSKCDIIYCNSEFAFLELEPASDFTKSEKISSLKKIILQDILFYDTDATRNLIIDPIYTLFDYLNSIYQKSQSYIVEGEYRSSIEQILPARKKYRGYFYKPDNITNIQEINSKSIFQFDIQSTQPLCLNLKTWDPISNEKTRVDITVSTEENPTDLFLFLEDKKIFIDLNSLEYPRQIFLERLSNSLSFLVGKYSQLKLFNILEKIQEGQEVQYKIDTLLSSRGKNFFSNFLHGDLNLSNILMCYSESVNQYHPIIIDFYESGIQGNYFLDFARFEIEIVVLILVRILRKYFNLNNNTTEIPERAIQFICNYENNLFLGTKEKRIKDTGDFILYEIRDILTRVIKNSFSVEFKDLEWLKNYLLCCALYGLKFNNFKYETNLAKLVAVIWGLRLLYRVEHFDEISKETILKRSSGFFKVLTPYLELLYSCKNASIQTKEELGIETISIKLFVDFYDRVKNLLQIFFKSEKKLFILVNETGTGKSTFVEHYIFENSNKFPILLLSGMNHLEEENYFFDIIFSKLGGTFHRMDWHGLVNEEVSKQEKNFLIIIENIYYNFNPEKVISALVYLLQTLKDKTNIKILITCTPSFYDEYLSRNNEIQTNVFTYEDEKFVSLTTPDDLKCTELVNKYFTEYNIIGELLSKAKTLPKNPGVLKLFCEVKANSNIGKPEHIFVSELIAKYIEKKLEFIYKQTGIVEKVLYEILQEVSRLVETGESLALKISVVEKVLSQKLPPEIQISTLIHLLTQAGIFVSNKNFIKFRFSEIPAYLLANYILEDWDYFKPPLEEKKEFVLTKLSEIRKKPFNEILLYYLLTGLYINQDKNILDFYEALELLFSQFDKQRYAILQVFGKTVYSLPKVDSKLIKKILDLETKSKILLKKTPNDFALQRAYGSCFNLLDNNIIYNFSAVQWIEKFEKIIDNPKKIINTLASDSFKWDEFHEFLKKDFSKNSNFIRNYINPIFIKLNQRVWYKEKSIILLAEKLLNLSDESKNQFGWFEINVYEILFNIVIEKEETYVSRYKTQALQIILKRKVGNLELLKFIIQRFYKILEDDPLEINYFIQFLIQYNNFNQRIDQIAFSILLKEIEKINYEALPSNIRKELDTYLSYIPPEMSIFLLQKINLKNPTDKAKFENILRKKDSFRPHPEFLVCIIIKYRGQYLLRYNFNWEDYNWFGGELGHEYDDVDEKEEAIKIVKEKLKLEPSFFKLEKFGKLKQGYDLFSRTRKKIFHYVPSYYVLKLHDEQKWREFLSDIRNKLFSIEEILDPKNIEISFSVKKFLNLLENNFNLKQKLDAFSDVV